MPRRLLTLVPVLVAATAATLAVGASHGTTASAAPALSDGTALRPLPFHYDLYTFRGEGGATEVVSSYAVQARHLGREDSDGGVRYRFDVSLVVADTATTTVARSDDSVYVAVPEALDDDHLLHTHVSLQAEPSTKTVQRVVMTDAATPGRGQLYTTAFPVPDYHGPELVLSDIALGLPDPERGWTRGSVTLALLPTSQFPESSFDVFYEIYNLPAGHRYDTSVTIEQLVATVGQPVQDRRAVSLRFFGESHPQGGVLPELRRVDTSLGEGRYRITVEVTDETTGETATRSRLFHVQGWDPGTTMVEALPRRGWRGESGGR